MPTVLARRLRRAGLLIAAGLAILLWTLRGVRPLAFVAFIAIACPLIAAGVLIFLYAILTGTSNPGATSPEPPHKST